MKDLTPRPLTPLRSAAGICDLKGRGEKYYFEPALSPIAVPVAGSIRAAQEASNGGCGVSPGPPGVGKTPPTRCTVASICTSHALAVSGAVNCSVLWLSRATSLNGVNCARTFRGLSTNCMWKPQQSCV